MRRDYDPDLERDTIEERELNAGGARAARMRHLLADEAGKAMCECGHTAHWHSHDGEGDCEHDGDCDCEGFYEARTP